jgi:hypothetical protein
LSKTLWELLQEGIRVTSPVLEGMERDYFYSFKGQVNFFFNSFLRSLFGKDILNLIFHIRGNGLE